MPTTIAAAFKTLSENLEITDLQATTASTRQKNVREVVEAELSVLDSFLTGSYMRSTMIAPLKEADIDIFVVLDPKYYSAAGQASLLDLVKKALLKTYTRTPKISRNGQAVTITFTDFVVDVVPAFYRLGGGYLIPNSADKEWISTNPKAHVTLMSELNAVHNGDLVPIVKMIKGWNKKIGDGFVSFYLELLAIRIFTNVTISNYSSGMRYFFDKARALIRYTLTDPAGLGSQVRGLRNVTNVTDAVSRFETAYQRALKAEAFVNANKIQNSFDEWRKIFGDYFPAYG